jgi:hypothetical protein
MRAPWHPAAAVDQVRHGHPRTLRRVERRDRLDRRRAERAQRDLLHAQPLGELRVVGDGQSQHGRRRELRQPGLASLVEHEQRGPPSAACQGDRLGAKEDEHTLAMEVARQLRGQPRAAAPRRAADHGHHARAGARPLPRVPQSPQLGVAPEERRGRLELARQLDRRRRHERLVMAQDRRVELAQLGARLDTELPDERGPRVAVRLERVGLAAAAVERQQQVRAQPLAQRMLGDERLELRDQRPLAPERELGLDALLPRDQTQLLEPLDVDARKRLELEVRERPATPQALTVP